MTSLALRGASLQLGCGEGGTTTSQPPAAAADTLHDDKNRLLCMVCMEVEKSVALLLCSHLCLCGACTEIIMASTKQCPVCRAPVATTQRFFMKMRLRALVREEMQLPALECVKCESVHHACARAEATW